VATAQSANISRRALKVDMQSSPSEWLYCWNE
jgi:hypothetical protein